MSDFKPGDKICWFYTHHFNSVSMGRRMKRGVFVRLIEPKRNPWAAPEKAIVQFEGNKGTSRVNVAELKST